MKELTAEFIKTLLPVRKTNSNKSDFGKVLNITGSNKYLGAGMLSALAALRVGAGYVFLCSQIDATKCYEKFSFDLIYKTHENFNSDIMLNIIDEIKPNAVVLGCGLSFGDKTVAFVDTVIDYLKINKIKTVIDADGLNILAALNKNDLNENFVLTPHPKELSRLLNTDIQEILHNREKYISEAQKKYNSAIVLKGHDSLIAFSDGEIYKNPTGNSVLAKAGTGDVLSGMTGGFLAQNLSCKDASLLAVYLHGLAGEIYSEKYSEYSMLASELIDYIPNALMQVTKSYQKQ